MRQARHHGRNTKPSTNEWVKALLGAVVGLVLGYCLLRYGFDVHIFESPDSHPPAGTQQSAKAPGEKAPEGQVAKASGKVQIPSVADPSEMVPVAPNAGNSVADEAHSTTRADESTNSSPHDETMESEMRTPVAADPFADPNTQVVSGAPSAGVKQAVPSPEQQSPLAEQVRELFKAEYAAARTPELQTSLASRLKGEASTIQSDPIATFVMLHEAYELALSAGDCALAEALACELDAAFDVDFSSVMVHLWTGVAKSAKASDVRCDIATKCLHLVPTLLDVKRFDDAFLLVSAAEELATQVGQDELRRRATNLMAESQIMQQEWDTVRVAMDKLQEVPDDAEANLVAGRYLCCEQQDWVNGLPLVAKGSNSTLAAAAKADLVGAVSPIERLNIADVWYTACTSGDDCDGFVARAQFWYQKAAPELTGLDGIKANKRLQESAGFGKQVPEQQDLPRSIVPLEPIVAKAIQATWARHLEIPVTESNSIGMTFTLIPPGEFVMGSPPSEAGRRDDEVLHRVKITKPFYLGTAEITQRQYEIVMGVNPSEFSHSGRRANDAKGMDTTCLPVEGVSWPAAMEFCSKLCSLPHEKDHGRFYRLPTESEWEYACRAGSQAAYCFGDERRQLGGFAWCANNSGDAPLATTDDFGTLPFQEYWRKIVGNGGRPHAVATRSPNAWGLFDMHGNVWEHCDDSYVLFDPSQQYVDPIGRSNSNEHVSRGGSWFFPDNQCRSAFRRIQKSEETFDDCGFRVACTIGN